MKLETMIQGGSAPLSGAFNDPTAAGSPAHIVGSPPHYAALLNHLQQQDAEAFEALESWVQNGQEPADEGMIKYLARHRWLDETGTQPRTEVYWAFGYNVPVQGKDGASPEGPGAVAA